MDTINISQLDEAVAQLLKQYGIVVQKASQSGVNKAAKLMKDALVEASPVGTGALKKSWKIQNGKGKETVTAYIGSTRTVKSRGGDIPLVNILEYSTVHGHPFIEQTYNGKLSEIAETIANEIKKEA